MKKGTVAVTWNEAELQQAIENGVGAYVINGQVEGGKSVKAHLTIKPENFVINASFEDNDRSMWEVIYPEGIEPHASFQQKASDAKTEITPYTFIQERVSILRYNKPLQV